MEHDVSPDFIFKVRMNILLVSNSSRSGKVHILQSDNDIKNVLIIIYTQSLVGELKRYLPEEIDFNNCTLIGHG
jgi:hypothetical protein